MPRYIDKHMSKTVEEHGFAVTFFTQRRREQNKKDLYKSFKNDR